MGFTNASIVEYYIHFQSVLGYPANRGFFLASRLACTKSFTSLVFHVVGLFTSPADYANDFVARKKPLLAAYTLFFTFNFL